MPFGGNDAGYTIRCHYTNQPIEQILLRDDLLAAISYDVPCLPTTNPSLYKSGLKNLGNNNQTEIWTASGDIEHGTQDQCHWSQTEQCLLVSLVIDDTTGSTQSESIESAYTKLLSLLEERGYPHIVRAWNYMPDINKGIGDDERYRHFCTGRERAFKSHQYNDSQYPSACALGHAHGQTIIYLLATKEAGQHFENPNQQSAYSYPRQYGPKSPSFARATLVNWSSEKAQLFVSGTASIVGHSSVLGDVDNHQDNLAIQLATTFSNIDQLLAHVAAQANLPIRPSLSSLKVYIRHYDDYLAIKSAVEDHYGDINDEVLYLQADICRKELLVEIDGLCEL